MTVIIQYLNYDPIDDRYDDILTVTKKTDLSDACAAERHIYDYVITNSQNEKRFVEHLDKSTEVVVYAKLPRGFTIPTPVGSYNPDWAIAFEHGKAKHVFFVAETKGSMSSLQLKAIETANVAWDNMMLTAGRYVIATTKQIDAKLYDHCGDGSCTIYAISAEELAMTEASLGNTGQS